jgi:hypothetical protein
MVSQSISRLYLELLFCMARSVMPLKKHLTAKDAKVRKGKQQHVVPRAPFAHLAVKKLVDQSE